MGRLHITTLCKEGINGRKQKEIVAHSDIHTMENLAHILKWKD
jgi:hypothetical protein